MFTNLQSYLRANQGQSGRLAGDISQDIEKQAQSALQEYETQAADLGADIDAASLDEQAVQEATDFAANLADVSTEAPQISPQNDVVTRIAGLTRTPEAERVVDITAPLSEEQRKQSERIRQGFGEVSLDTEGGQGRFQTALGLGERAERAAGETATTAGRRSLLEEQFGRPDYTAGEKSFDELLLSGDQEARGRFSQLRSSFAGEQAPTARIEQGRQELIDRLSQARSTSAGLQRQYEENLAGAKEGLLGRLSERANNLEQERVRRANEALAQAGLAGVNIQDTSPELYGVALSEFLRDPVTGEIFNFNEDITSSQVATAEDVGRLRALYELAGLDPNTIDPAFRGDTFTQQRLGAPELQLDQFEQQVIQQARNLANQVVEASAAQIPPSDQLAYRRMADERPFFNEKRFPEMIKQAENNLESAILNIAEQDKRLGSGAAASAIEQQINEGKQAVQMATAYEALLGIAAGDMGPAGLGVRQFDQKPIRNSLEQRGVSADMVKQLAPITNNPVFKAFSETIISDNPRTGKVNLLERVNSAEELNERFVQPIFNQYAPIINNPRVDPRTRQEISKGLQAISSFVESLEHKEFLREFSKDPKASASSLLTNAYVQDANTKLQRLKGK